MVAQQGRGRVSELHDMELLDTLQAVALRRGDMARVKQLADQVDSLMLDRLASATCPESGLEPTDLVAHVYRIAADAAAAKAAPRCPQGRTAA